MKILNISQTSWILLGAIDSLIIAELCLSNHLAHAQSIVQSTNSNQGTPQIPRRSKLDIPIGSTKIDTTSTAKDPIRKIEGTWVNNNIDTQGISKLIIKKVGNRHSVHLFGKCNPTDCDLGKRLLRSSFWENSGSTHIEATYKESTVVRDLKIYSIGIPDLSPPTKIRVSFSNRFIDKSGKPSYSSDETFHKIQVTKS